MQDKGDTAGGEIISVFGTGSGTGRPPYRPMMARILRSDRYSVFLLIRSRRRNHVSMDGVRKQCQCSLVAVRSD